MMAIMPGKTKSPPATMPPKRAMHQPADIGRELLRLGARQQHAIVERMQETRLPNPSLLLDEDAVHHGDLSGRAAEAQRGDAQPDPHGLVQRNTMRWKSRGGSG